MDIILEETLRDIILEETLSLCFENPHQLKRYSMISFLENTKSETHVKWKANVNEHQRLQLLTLIMPIRTFFNSFIMAHNISYVGGQAILSCSDLNFPFSIFVCFVYCTIVSDPCCLIVLIKVYQSVCGCFICVYVCVRVCLYRY